MHTFLDLLFPPACVQCQRLGSYLCQNCQYQLRYYTQPLRVDLESPALDQLFACCTHAHGARKLIRTLKFKSAYRLTQTLVQLMVEHIPFPEDMDIITWIPLHPQRHRQRGFNQAQILGRQLGEWLDIPTQPLLRRTKYTSPQAELNREDRLTHLREAFAVIPDMEIQGKTIAIVDDICTTGTTLMKQRKCSPNTERKRSTAWCSPTGSKSY